jgi:thiamine biosynthesis lipoprotein ApbE
VTLVGDKGAIIDPLSKVPFILGSEEGMKIARKFGAEAIIVDEQGKVFMTDGIKNMADSSNR